MKFKGKNILIISPEPWSHIFVSKHHYAVYLSRLGNTIFFLNPPSHQVNCVLTEFDNLYSVNYTGFTKGLRFLPSVLSRKLIRSKFEFLQILCSVKFDVVWSFDNSVFFDFASFPKEVLKISHIVDLNQDFQMESAAKTADICFGTSHLITNKLKQYNRNSFFINHGFNSSDIVEDHLQIPGNNNIKAVLIGNLLMPYLDWEILLMCVKKHPEVDFVFYGPNADKYLENNETYNKSKRDLMKYTNTFFPGKVPASSISSILNNADLLLVSYQEMHHNDQANPHKIMEYFGSGKVTVATNTLEFKALAKESLIAMSERNTQFPDVFDNVVSSLDKWNDKNIREKRREYALNNSYNMQIERIEKLIQQHVYQ